RSCHGACCRRRRTRASRRARLARVRVLAPGAGAAHGPCWLAPRGAPVRREQSGRPRPFMSMLRLLLSAFLLPGLLSAQANPEAALTAEAVQKLCAYAKDTLAAGYPDRAEEIWREVLNEYDTNNA